MIKVNLPQPLPGRMFNLGKTAAPAARFMALAALIFINSALAVVATAQRSDNRRLFWTGTNGSTWDNSTASWMTTGSYLSYADSGAGSDTWALTEAMPEATFTAGDVVVFDSFADQGWVLTGTNTWYPTSDPAPDIYATRVIEIVAEGVIASDIVVGGPGSFVFTGGGITAISSSVAADSVQLSGTGIAVSQGYVAPSGRLFKYGTGVLTLSNTVANHFEGGIHLLGGGLSITDNRALGDNNIILSYRTDAVGIQGNWGHIFGDELVKQIEQRATTAGSSYITPAIVRNYAGQLYTVNSVNDVSLHIASSAAGIDITGDIYMGPRILTLNIEGDTTISGRILGNINAYGAVGGAIVKTGPGTLTLTGSQNWFYASGGSKSYIEEGRVVATHEFAIGTGPFSISPGAVLEFRGVAGSMVQAFSGGGSIEITEGSDLKFNWRDGVLDEYDKLPSVAGATYEIGSLAVSGTSRFSAIASGTYTTVLGGPNVDVLITERSSLVLGREGISADGTGKTAVPLTYPIYAGVVTLDQGSTLVFSPNSFLNTGDIYFFNESGISFGASGVSQLKFKTSNIMTQEELEALCMMPLGMELVKISRIYDDPSAYWYEFVVINQGANPLNDIAMTINTLDAVHDTISTRIADDFLDPVARLVPSRGRKWVNNLWMRYLYSEVEYDEAGVGTPGINGHIGGALIGFNGILPGRVFVGAHVGFADNNLSTTNNSTLKTKQKFFGIHAAQIIGKFYLAFDAATGKVDSDSIRIEPNGSIVRAKWDNSYYSGAIQFGARFSPWKQGMLKPYVGVRYSNVKISNYDERGEARLRISNFNDTLSQTLYGLAASQKFVVLKRDLSVDASIGRKHVVSAPRSLLNATFSDAPEVSVPLKRGEYYEDLTTFSLSGRMFLSAHTQIGLSCDYEYAPSRNRITFSALFGYSW